MGGRSRLSAGLSPAASNGPGSFDRMGRRKIPGPLSIRAIAFAEVVSGATGAAGPTKNAMSLTTAPEDAVAQAFAIAAEPWPSRGVPRNPGGWITTTAGNRAIDRLRRESTHVDRHLAAHRLGCGPVCGPVCGARQSRGMDIFRILDREVVGASAFVLPNWWTWDPPLAGHASASAMAATARAMAVDSDAAVDALLSVTDHTELADCIIVSATVGLVRSRCRRGLIPPQELWPRSRSRLRDSAR